MATITTQFNEGFHGFAFAGNPMVIRVVPRIEYEEAIFPQVIVNVHVEMGTMERISPFEIPISLDQHEVLIDISSAIRGVINAYDYSAPSTADKGSVTYPYATFGIVGWEKYMVNGSVIESEHSNITYGVAYLGRLSDYEIWKAGEHNYPTGETVKFSTKPKGEIFHFGQLQGVSSFVPGTESTPGYVKTTFSAVTEGNIDNRKRETFLFVNSRGVFETISVLTRESKDYEFEAKVMAKGNTPSYVPRPGLTTHKTLGPATWHMSSGYVNREWMEWFTTEFMAAEYYWMLLDGRWLPVTVTPEGNSKAIYDRSDPALKEVQFKVNSAIKGRIG